MRTSGVGALLMIALLIMEGSLKMGNGFLASQLRFATQAAFWGWGSLKSYLCNENAWRDDVWRFDGVGALLVIGQPENRNEVSGCLFIGLGIGRRW